MVLGWYSLVFEGILTLTIVLKKWTLTIAVYTVVV
jgi:hypothetical protein